MTDYNKLLYKLKKYNNYSNISKFNKYNSKYKILYGGVDPDGVVIPDNALRDNLPTTISLTKEQQEIEDIKNKYRKFLKIIDKKKLNPETKEEYDKLCKDIHIIPGLYEELITKVFKDKNQDYKDRFINDNEVSRAILNLFHTIDEKLVSRKAYDDFYEDVKNKSGVILDRLKIILERLELAKQKYFDTLVELEYYKLGISPKEPDCNEDLLNLLKVIREYILLKSNINEVKFDIDMFNPTLTSIEQVLDIIDASKLAPDAQFKVASDLYDKLQKLEAQRTSSPPTTPRILDINGRQFDITNSKISIALPATKPVTPSNDATKNTFSQPILKLVTNIIKDNDTKAVQTPATPLPATGGYRDNNIDYIQLMLNYQAYL